MGYYEKREMWGEQERKKREREKTSRPREEPRTKRGDRQKEHIDKLSGLHRKEMLGEGK